MYPRTLVPSCTSNCFFLAEATLLVDGVVLPPLKLGIFTTGLCWEQSTHVRPDLLNLLFYYCSQLEATRRNGTIFLSLERLMKVPNDS